MYTRVLVERCFCNQLTVDRVLILDGNGNLISLSADNHVDCF